MGVAGPGVPGWIDLGSPDLEASKRFYGEVFGWDADANPDPQYGGYTTFRKDGKAVAGLMPLMSPEQPVVWSTYVIVEDAAEVTAHVEEAGGSVMVAPMVVPEQGTMAVYVDPAGAVLGAWQPDKMSGAELLNQPGALAWAELATRDTDGAKRFYPAVFGWQPSDSDAAGMTYTEWKIGDRPVGGMMAMGDMFPAEVPPHWGVYFAVEDCDDSVATVQKAGGTVVMPAMDIPQGRFAGVADPQGAPFYVMAMAG